MATSYDELTNRIIERDGCCDWVGNHNNFW